jgi:hypothetical protein
MYLLDVRTASGGEQWGIKIDDLNKVTEVCNGILQFVEVGV